MSGTLSRPADWRPGFLAAFSVSADFNRSCRAVGISPATVKNELATSPEFAEAHEEAYENFRESIELEIRRRAIDGWEEPVFQQGEEVGRIRRFDSRLLELLAKRHIPAYRNPNASINLGEGAVLVIPATAADTLEWEKQNAIDADFQETGSAEAQGTTEPNSVHRSLGAVPETTATEAGEPSGEGPERESEGGSGGGSNC